MKHRLIVFALILSCSNFLFAQQFSVAANIGYHNSHLSSIQGYADTARQSVGNTYSQEISFGYTGKRGLMLSLGVGSQKDRFFFNEIVPYEEPDGLNFYKYYSSYPVSFSGGYIYQLSALPKYFIFVNGTLGVAKIKTIDADQDEEYYGRYYVLQEGTYDTIHYKQFVIDESENQMQLQVRASIGGEFRADHFFLRVCAEYRTWGDYMGQISYHSVYSSTLYGFNRDRSGSFRVRPAYAGIVFSAGFYFPRKEKSN